MVLGESTGYGFLLKNKKDAYPYKIVTLLGDVYEDVDFKY